MHKSRGTWVRVTAVIAVVLMLWVRFGWHRRHRPSPNAIPDRSLTSPLNQPGGGSAPDEAYSIYSALYQEPTGEPLAFSQDSVTDILKLRRPPGLHPEQRAMTDAFSVILRSSLGEQVYDSPDTNCSHGQSGNPGVSGNHAPHPASCDRYAQIRHGRFLGIPGPNQTHTRALVSVVRMCGPYCGNGGIFEVEKTGATWRRADTTDFTRNCSWMY
jgi:hypothetical protein